MLVGLFRLAHKLFGHRWYYSTSCLHDQHTHCRATTNIEGAPKVSGECKWCDAICICRCHRTHPIGG